MFKGFKEFIMRGNVIDLAVAVVVGAAFGTVITSFVSNVINKLLAAVVSKPDFSAFKLHLGGTDITYGVFLNDLVGFLLVACAVYVFMVAPMNAWKARAARAVVPADPTHKKCSECLSEIPVAAKRCAFCTSVLTAS
jgi:large conductance mechanosensitive channel